MLRTLFESFYNENVEKIAYKLISNNENFNYIRNVDGVYEEYLNQKTLLRTVIKSGENKESVLLDGHKVSACITCAIIRVRLLTNKTIDDDGDMRPYSLDKAFRMNEQLAFLSGLSCLFEYMAEDKENLYSDSNDTDKTSFIFPKTGYENRSSYMDSLVRGLYYSNVLSNINPLLLANIFFLIESYHRQSVKLRALESSLKSHHD